MTGTRPRGLLDRLCTLGRDPGAHRRAARRWRGLALPRRRGSARRRARGARTDRRMVRMATRRPGTARAGGRRLGIGAASAPWRARRCSAMRACRSGCSSLRGRPVICCMRANSTRPLAGATSICCTRTRARPRGWTAQPVGSTPALTAQLLEGIRAAACGVRCGPTGFVRARRGPAARGRTPREAIRAERFGPSA